MSNAFTLRLIALTCHEGQENDGDEIYLKMDGNTIFTWEKIGRKFARTLKRDNHTNAFDFRTCRFAVAGGWQDTDAYQPSDFLFKQRSQPIVLELWESDEGEFLLGDDDRLGRLIVDGSRREKGEMVHIFPFAGADYELRYVVLNAE